MSQLVLAPDPHHLAHKAACHITALATQAITQRGTFSLALAGGSTPTSTYRFLATEEFASRIDWTCIHIFFGDERCVPPDHHQSNYRMAWDSFLRHVPIPEKQIHRIQGELDVEVVARKYEYGLRDHVAAYPVFDLVLLGLGSDGHTASIFPGTEAIHEETRWVLPVYHQQQATWRISLTPAFIQRAQQVTFIVSGEEKAEIIRQVLHGPYQPDLIPAQMISSQSGQVSWYLDQAAASLLPE